MLATTTTIVIIIIIMQPFYFDSLPYKIYFLWVTPVLGKMCQKYSKMARISRDFPISVVTNKLQKKMFIFCGEHSQEPKTKSSISSMLYKKN